MTIFSNEFLHRVSAGKVKGARIIHKFGQSDVNSSFRPITDDNVYQTPTEAVSLKINGAGADGPTGYGARVVVVEGLDGDFNFQSEEVTMAASTFVTLANQYTRVFRMYVKESGIYSNILNPSSHGGAIQLRAVVGNTLWASIRNYEGIGLGASLIGGFTVPKGHTAHIIRSNFSIEDTRPLDLTYMARENADIVTEPYSALKALGLFRTTTSVDDTVPAGLGKELFGPCDIVALARIADGGAVARVSVSFDLLILDQR